MMMGDDRCVVDTNLLVYSTVSGNPWHHEARRWLAALQRQGTILCVTTQILREYLVVLTRGDVFETTFTVSEALDELEALLPSLEVLGETGETATRLRDLMRRYQVRGKQIHDANIVAVMSSYGISRLATYNSIDFERFKEVMLASVPTTLKGSSEPASDNDS
jgi:predicted nucleic acid-binding protein